MSMTKRETNSFLNERWVARVATLRKDGSPHVTPVWYAWDGMKFIIVTRRDRLKYRNIGRDNRVALCIDKPEPPTKGVLVEGKAEATEGDLRRWMKKVIARYVDGETARETHLNRWLDEPRTLLLVYPNKMLTWDNSKRR